MKHTVLAWGESHSSTHVELDQRELEAVLRVFDAVNDTAEAVDNYSPWLYLFEGVIDVLPWTFDGPCPINRKHWNPNA